jgi:hypothetical protein
MPTEQPIEVLVAIIAHSALVDQQTHCPNAAFRLPSCVGHRPVSAVSCCSNHQYDRNGRGVDQKLGTNSVNGLACLASGFDCSAMIEWMDESS